MPGPPPPPPPPPLGMLGGGAPPPPPPIGGLPQPSSGDRAALLGDISGGIKLKKVDKSLIKDRSEVKPAGGSTSGGGSSASGGGNSHSSSGKWNFY